MPQLTLSQADVSKLAAILNDSSTLLLGKWGIRVPGIQHFLDRFSEVVRGLNSQIGARNVAFEIKTGGLDEGSSFPFSVQYVADQLEGGSELLLLDLNFRVGLHPASLSTTADRSDLCNYSEANENVILLVEGSGFIIIVNGVQKRYVNVYAPGAREPRLTRHSHSSREYELLIREHHERQLPNEMDAFWSNRDDRILVGDGKTEWVLHRSLWRWLLLNVNDGRVVGEVQKLSPERTDIEIEGLRGTGTYIIEVKWLGKNRAGKRYQYDHPRIKAGVDQVKNYLSRDQLVTKAILVCYDGRSKEDHETKSSIDPADKVTRSEYYVLYLPSESAS